MSLILLSGPSNCGKTTYANKLSDDFSIDDTPFVYVSSNEVRDQLKIAKESPHQSPVFEKMAEMVTEALGEKKTVIVDTVNTSATNRLVFIQIAAEHGVPVTIYWSKPALDVLYRRNRGRPVAERIPEQVIKNQWNKYHPPIESEAVRATGVTCRVVKFT